MNADTSQVLWLAAAMIAIASGSILSRRHTKNGYTFYQQTPQRFTTGQNGFNRTILGLINFGYVELWQSCTTTDWQETIASLITLLKIAEHDFFDDLIFLIDMAGERQAMAHRNELEAQEVI